MMTTSSGHESLQAMTRLQQDPKVPDSESAFCAVPMLFLAGSADGVSDQQASIKFFASMGNTDKEFKLFDGLYHKVYEEPEKEDVLNYLAQWLLRRFPLETRHPNGTPMEALKKLEGTAMKGVPTVRAPRTEL
ncbi:hypothetical protein PHYBOEH_006979 [Phytophthora boehmeriae]|uniref:Serine aminopeptidase S33 domain-containing protein n=1 Tax=Phytophthora boehmeriae TaxID=109152 RepID=A0A8T1X7Q7_9STRA|nr:hypothetical protein PHYBOEH_006979 [Phytophthora boehmeriae]